MNIISAYTDFKFLGGAEKVCLQLARELNNSNEIPLVLTTTPLSEIHFDYTKDKKYQFIDITFAALLKLQNGSVILSHHRKITTVLVVFSFFLCKHFKIIHIAHTTFNNYRYLTLFPRHIVAVSNAVKNNLIRYFKVHPNSITVIYNGLKDEYIPDFSLEKRERDCVKVIIPARIEQVKKQIEFFKYTKNQLSEHITIYFAGDGPLFKVLKDIIGDSSQYILLGHIKMMQQLYAFDYVSLFSEKEGLPTALIEGCMFNKPLITNALDSVMEINIDKYNGYVAKSYTELISLLNNIPLPDSATYKILSSNSRRHYTDKFTFKEMVTKYKSLIEFYTTG